MADSTDITKRAAVLHEAAQLCRAHDVPEDAIQRVLATADEIQGERSTLWWTDRMRFNHREHDLMAA